MASLLERMDIAPTGNGNGGPIRTRGGVRAASLPYARPHKLGQSKADADSVWKHDLYSGPGKDLGSRLGISDSSSSGLLLGSGSTTSAPRVNASGAAMALRQAIGLPSAAAAAGSKSGGVLSIKGASSGGGVSSNVVEVKGLVAGTSPADVETIFKRCGTILESTDVTTPSSVSPDSDSVTIRLKFKSPDEARAAVKSFDGVSADGRVLSVKTVGIASAALGGRIGGGASAGAGAGRVDVLMDDEIDGFGSKMRSDNLLNEPGAVVLTMPPGMNPESVRWTRGGRVGGRGRGGRGGGRRGGGGRGARRGGGGMDLD